jgi:hypothetical protein
LLDDELEWDAGCAVGAQGDETAAMSVEQRPKADAIGRREREGFDRGAIEESERTFVDGSGQRVDRFEAIEEKQQPVRATFVGPFADHGEQVKAFGGQAEAGFLGGLASGAFVRGLAEVCL